MFFKTIDLTGPELEKAIVQTLKQEEFIQTIYKKNSTRGISPSQIYEIVQTHYGFNWPITSCRRAITVLTKDNVLSKLPTQVMGIFGKPEHTWRFKQTSTQSKLF